MKTTKQLFFKSSLGVAALLFAGALTGCVDNTIGSQVDADGVPQIHAVRYISPDSSRNLQKIGPGQWVVLLGSNMDATVEVLFDGVATSFNPALTTDSSLIIMVPADLPFGSMDPASEEMNTIVVRNANGSSKLDFPVVPPAPQVTGISNEFALAGQTITLTGQYLYLIEEIAFPGGATATEFESAPNGTWLRVTVPSGVSGGGAIEVKTSGGTAPSTPAAPFNDPAGLLSNFDDVNNFGWGANLVNDPALFPNGWGNYAYMKADGVAGGDWGWWNGGRSINLNQVVWVDPADLGAPVSNFALKFEIYVRTPVEHGTLLIRSDDDWKHIGRFEPWTKTGKAYAPQGWTTVTFPLTEFRTKSAAGVDGGGDSVGSLLALLGSDGASPLGFMYVNDDADVVQDLDLAIDNIRIVKIAS